MVESGPKSKPPPRSPAHDAAFEGGRREGRADRGRRGTYGTLVVQTTGPNAGNYTYTPSGLPATCATLTDTFDYTLTAASARASPKSAIG